MNTRVQYRMFATRLSTPVPPTVLMAKAASLICQNVIVNMCENCISPFQFSALKYITSKYALKMYPLRRVFGWKCFLLNAVLFALPITIQLNLLCTSELCDDTVIEIKTGANESSLSSIHKVLFMCKNQEIQFTIERLNLFRHFALLKIVYSRDHMTHGVLYHKS